MDISKKAEDSWNFNEITENSGRAYIDDERGNIIVCYDLNSGTVGITVTMMHGKDRIKQKIDFERGKEPKIAHTNETRGFPALQEYVKKNVGSMAGAFMKELELLELEGILDYERIKQL